MSRPRCWIFSMNEPGGMLPGVARGPFGAIDATGSPQFGAGVVAGVGAAVVGGVRSALGVELESHAVNPNPPIAITIAEMRVGARRIIDAPAVVGRYLAMHRARRRVPR